MAIFRTPDWSLNKSKYTFSADQGEETSERKNVVLAYAPVLYQYTPDNSVRDFLADYDYDGDKNTSNNRENVEKHNLKATIHYSILETPTHYFITYLLYHVEDSWVDYLCKITTYWVGGQHENDGENIQIVVEKASKGGDSEIVILAFQNHNKTDYLLHPTLTNKKHNSNYNLIDSNIIKTGGSYRPFFFLEPGKHGIYSENDKFSLCTSAANSYEEVLFTPVSSFEVQGDTWEKTKKEFKYGFKSIKTNLWDQYTDNKAIGNNGIMDGGVNVTLERGEEKIVYKNIPRFFNGDEYSFLLLKKDAGIMPFFFGGGKLFFDPAHYYKVKFNLGNEDFKHIDWQTCYLYNPYLPVDYATCN